jgi:4-hydroxy-4-methyl-2-oxoglutarate aldolase
VPSGEIKTLRQRLEALDTCLLSDAMDSFGLSGVVAEVGPIGPPRRIAGPARTVQLDLDSADNPHRGAAGSRHLGTTAIVSADPGDVVVVAHRSRTDAAGWGGVLAQAAIAAGIIGVVVDGVCRDVDDYFQHDLPVWGRGAIPASARGRVVETSTGEPIRLGDILVTPGDWIVADRSGVVAIGLADLERVLAKAEWLAAREVLMVADLHAGVPVTEVMGHNYESMLLN